jgi:hypothetical protein
VLLGGLDGSEATVHPQMVKENQQASKTTKQTQKDNFGE